MKYDHLQDFIKCYNPNNRFNRTETEYFKSFSYEELIQRDNISLDIFWIKDESLGDFDNLPDPIILARGIIEDLETALEQFSDLYEDLNEKD